MIRWVCVLILCFCVAAGGRYGSAWQRESVVGCPGATQDAWRDILATACSVSAEPRVLCVNGRVANAASE